MLDEDRHTRRREGTGMARSYHHLPRCSELKGAGITMSWPGRKQGPTSVYAFNPLSVVLVVSPQLVSCAFHATAVGE